MSPSPPDSLVQRPPAAIEHRLPAAAEAARSPMAVRLVAARPTWTSIERKLPLLILALLIPTVLTLAVCVYTEVRTELAVAASTRVQANVREVGLLCETGFGRTLDFLQRTARRPEIVEWMRHPDAAKEDAVTRRLGLYLTRRPTVAEIWDLDGKLLMRKESATPAGAEEPGLVRKQWPAPTTTGLQRLQACDGKPYIETVAEIHDTDPDTMLPLEPLGYLVLRRNFVGGEGAAMLSRLIGTHTALWLGNRDGSLWTDIDHVVTAPPIDLLSDGPHVFTNADGVLRAGAGLAIANTPWVVCVESDATDMLAPADHLLTVILLVGGSLLTIGAFAAWGISRRIAGPLREATEASEAIAAGDYGRRLVLRAHDEVGRLTVAFNTMAAEVEGARAQQEALVAQRTADLSQALRQLREAQDDLVRQEKLALMGQLAGSVGHELRNPLGVMNNAIFYLDEVLDDAAPEVREYLGILRRQVSLSEKIIRDLLDFTRHRLPEAEDFDLQQVVDMQLARLGPVQIAVDVRIPANLPLARADAVQIGQVLFNLLTNAVQAMEGRAGAALRLLARADDACIRLEVADNGPGIPDDVRERIFEPLFTTRARGIGLGLSVSRRLAELNGGSLQLQPAAAGRGATFVLQIPRAEAHQR